MRFQKIVEEQVQLRSQHIILSPLVDINAVLGQEYAKGEVAGIEFMKDFIPSRLAAVMEEISEIVKEMEDDSKTT